MNKETMNKETIIESLLTSYNDFVSYITTLPTEEYRFKFQQKWSAGQQLEHIVLCIKPIFHVFSMDKEVLGKQFGKTDRQGQSYQSIQIDYTEKLAINSKTQERFIPNSHLSLQKEALAEVLLKMIDGLCAKVALLEEHELDSLQAPHPLLGNLTLRELLYNTIYHVKHHHHLTKKYLTYK